MLRATEIGSIFHRMMQITGLRPRTALEMGFALLAGRRERCSRRRNGSVLRRKTRVRELEFLLQLINTSPCRVSSPLETLLRPHAKPPFDARAPRVIPLQKTGATFVRTGAPLIRKFSKAR